MSKIILNKAATPSSPAANKVSLQYSSDAPGVGTNVKLTAKDESGNVVVLGGFATKDYRMIKTTILTSASGTFTPTTGAQALRVEMVGGGGAGGGVATAATNSGAGGGGGAGAYSAVWLTGTLKSSYSYACGAAGTPGAAGGNPGGNGGDTTFDSPSVCTAKGGTGGTADTVTTIHAGGQGGAGGVGSSGVGDLLSSGQPGGTGLALAAAQALSGAGGMSYFGGGAVGKKSQGNGNPGAGYGAGGSGGTILSGGADVAGGAGVAGVIRVWEFA